MFLQGWDDPIGESVGPLKCPIGFFMFLWEKEPGQEK